MLRRPPRSTLFPYTTLFRSALVNSAPTFTEQHLVANGASELLAEIFGQSGTHARSAFGAAQLPFGSCVEIDLIAEVDRKSTRLNSSHVSISYAVFCLKKKTL